MTVLDHSTIGGAVSRRKLIATAGTVVAGGGAIAVAGSQPASGSVSTHDLGIPTASHEGEDGSVAALPIEISGAYEFATNSASRLTLTLSVASAPGAGDFQAVDYSEQTLSAASGAGRYSLSGEILDHPQLSADMFSADAEETVTREVPVQVVLEVFDGEQSVVKALAETVATIEVTNTSVKATAALTGDGQVGVEV